MAGEYEHLIRLCKTHKRARSLDPPVWIEIDQRLVDHDWQSFRTLTQFADQAKSQRQKQLLSCAAAELVRLFGDARRVCHVYF